MDRRNSIDRIELFNIIETYSRDENVTQLSKQDWKKIAKLYYKHENVREKGIKRLRNAAENSDTTFQRHSTPVNSFFEDGGCDFEGKDEVNGDGNEEEENGEKNQRRQKNVNKDENDGYEHGKEDKRKRNGKNEDNVDEKEEERNGKEYQRRQRNAKKDEKDGATSLSGSS